MNYFTKRTCTDLLGVYGVAQAAPSALAVLPDYARQVLAPLLGAVLAEDFQVLPGAALRSENVALAESDAAFVADWLVFACSGQGDFWLLHRHRNETGFYDHNAEELSQATVASLGLELEGWVEAANLFQQFDLLLETTPEAFTTAYTLQPAYKQAFSNELDKISPGLLRRLPFTNL